VAFFHVFTANYAFQTFTHANSLRSPIGAIGFPSRYRAVSSPEIYFKISFAMRTYPYGGTTYSCSPRVHTREKCLIFAIRNRLLFDRRGVQGGFDRYLDLLVQGRVVFEHFLGGVAALGELAALIAEP